MTKINPKEKESLTGIKKKRLCQRARDTNLTQQQLANEFKIGRSSVTEILLESDRWLNVENDTVIAKCKRRRAPLFPQIEDALALWFDNAIECRRSEEHTSELQSR